MDSDNSLSFRSELSSEVRAILNFIWAERQASGTWPLIRTVYNKWDKGIVVSHFSKLRVGLVVEQPVSGSTTTVLELRLPGILCTAHGDLYLHLLRRYLEFVRDLSFKDATKDSVTHAEVAQGLSLRAEEVALLGQLIFSGFLFGGGSHSDSFDTWNILLPKTVEDLPRIGPLDKFVDGLVLADLKMAPAIFIENRRLGATRRGNAGPGVAVTYGMQVHLRHLSTGMFLRSFLRTFTHPGSSRQQMAVAGPRMDGESVWVVKAGHGAHVILPTGPIAEHDMVRFEHQVTRKNLHSHNAPAPVTPTELEVTAFGKDGIGDPNDDWVVEPEGGGVWLSNQPVRLVHNNTRRNLHSHDVSDPVFTSGLQEVTGFGGQDDDDLWVAVAAGSLARTADITLGGDVKIAIDVKAGVLTDPNDPILGILNKAQSEGSAFQFSKTAIAVIQRAAALAKKSDRSVVTTSCILFAFGESAAEQPDTSRFVLDTLFNGRDFLEELADFLRNRGEFHEPLSAEELPIIGKVSPNLRSLIGRARAIALCVSGKTSEIHQRHLLGAMLVKAKTESEPNVWRRIERLGFDLPGLRREFRIFLVESPSSDSLAEWDLILGTASEDVRDQAFLEGTAGYSAEYCSVGGSTPVHDHLGVQSLANRLAELIALRETRLPLAIGLFGDWGSGKSHFMSLIDRRIKFLAEFERTQSPGPKSKWCHDVVPIYFNAWHYLDTNLWASLVAHIFDGLFEYLKPKGTNLQKLEELLEQAAGVTARASAELADAQAATSRAKVELEIAIANRSGRETAVRGILDGLESLLPTVTVATIAKQAGEILDLNKEVKGLGDLNEIIVEAKSVGGKAMSFSNIAWRRRGALWRCGWIAAVVIIPIAVSKLVAHFSGFLLSFRPDVAAFLAVAAVVASWARNGHRAAKHALNVLIAWQKNAEDRRLVLARTPEVLEAEKELAVTKAAEDSAQSRLAEAKAREHYLEEEARNYGPKRRLSRFIEQRTQSSDYRGQLGLITLARRDFEELSNIFSDSEQLTKEIDRLKLSKDQKDKSKAQALTDLGRPVDRIVLFIDDLDRCQPDKVVEVLQAVHLLLAFPLFAVVVGVDQRCLKQSLQSEFGGILGARRDSRAPGENEATRLDSGAATPLDYLEKIFHVPFHLPEMGSSGFSALVSKLTEPAVATPQGLAPLSQNQVSIPDTGKKAASIPETDPGLREDVSPEKPEVRSALSGSASRSVGSVPLHDWERSALAEFHMLIRTPRATTRLINTYRLVRAGIPKTEWQAYCGISDGGGEYQIAILLLASAAGFPAVAREWFEYIRNAKEGILTGAEAAPAELPREWKDFLNAYRATMRSFDPPPSPDLWRKWIDRVERFTF